MSFSGNHPEQNDSPADNYHEKNERVVVFLEGKGALNGTKVYGIFLSQSEFDWEYGSGLDKHFDVTDTHFLNPNDQQARKIIHSHSTKELPHNWRKRYQL